MTKKYFYPFDWLVIGYMVLLSLTILLFGRPITKYLDELILNIIVVISALLIIKHLQPQKQSPALFVRLLYPAMLFLFFYEQTGGLINLLFSNFLDGQLAAFEKSILGVNPTLWLDANLINVWITEILSLSYFTFYPMIYAFLLILYFKGDYYLIKVSLTAICLTFFVSFPMFFLYPIEGPRYYFAGTFIKQLNGPIFRPLVEFAQKGAVHGGCMPSTHFGVALVILILCLKYYKKAGIILIPIVAGLALGTFYGRYHYVSDVIIGGIIGLAATFVTLKYIKFDDNEESSMKKTERK